MAERSFARTGAAARKPAARTPAAAGPRPRRSAASETSPGPELAPPAQPAPAARVPVLAAADEVSARLAIALAALPDDIAALVTRYRGTKFDDGEWAEVGELVRLGIATAAPVDRQQVQNLATGLTTYARIHLLLGTSRTIAGWYGPDAVEQAVSGGPFRAGGRSFTPPEHFASSFNGRLRAIGRTLVPATPPPPKKFGGYEPSAPLTTAELAEVFDFCDAHRSPRFGNRIGERLARMVWLVCGTGAKNEDLAGVAGTAITATAHAVVFTTVGPVPRRIPVLASCEAAVLDAALAAGEEPLFARIPRATLVTDRVVESSGWREGNRFPLNAARLRQTWLAAVLSGGAPYAGIMRAAGVSGDRNLASLVARLPVLDEVTYEAALRCGTGPLPVAGQLLLPGLTRPAPLVPAREQA